MSPVDPAASPLVSVEELSELLVLAPDHRPVVLDVRYPGVGSDRDGHAEYLAGHVPGAVYVDLDAVLAAPHQPGITGRHPLPEPEVLEEGMRAAGVRDDRPVVVYDDWGSIAASRAWWLLRWAGHDDVRVLDGGWSAWHAAGCAVEQGEKAPERGDLTVVPGGRRAIEADQAGRIGDSGVLLDARPANRFRGEDETIDPVAGHIPGAVSLPAVELTGADGRFLPADRLAARFRGTGAEEGAIVGVYCGSGIQASLVVLAAEVAGAPEPALYAGSWSDWITDPERPVDVG